jgi:hypothetical protein
LGGVVGGVALTRGVAATATMTNQLHGAILRGLSVWRGGVQRCEIMHVGEKTTEEEQEEVRHVG